MFHTDRYRNLLQYLISTGHVYGYSSNHVTFRFDGKITCTACIHTMLLRAFREAAENCPPDDLDVLRGVTLNAIDLALSGLGEECQ